MWSAEADGSSPLSSAAVLAVRGLSSPGLRLALRLGLSACPVGCRGLFGPVAAEAPCEGAAAAAAAAAAAETDRLSHPWMWEVGGASAARNGRVHAADACRQGVSRRRSRLCQQPSSGNT